jgi:hypothetical protein
VGRALLLGVAFANLVYLRVWSELLAGNRADLFLHAPPRPAQYLALFANVIAMGIATAILIRMSPRFPKWIRLGLLFSGAALLLLALRAAFFQGQSVSPPVAYGLAAACLAAAFLGAVKHVERAERMAGYLVMAMSPFLLVTFPQAIRFVVTPIAQPADPPLAKFQGSLPSRRVVWIIFDEWDYRLTFVDRSPGLDMPAVDQLRRESFAAEAALPPGGDTRVSMPAFLQNRILSFTELGAEPNLFSRVRAQGWNAGVAGWYLPYCRVFSSALSSCYWDELRDVSNSGGTTFLGALYYQTRSLFETYRLSLFGQPTVARRHAEQYLTLLQQAQTMMGDARLAVTLLHLNVPHATFFYDAQSGSLGASMHTARGYPNALALVDRTLAELLQSLRQSGLASRTALIVSSDHGLRAWQEVDGKEDHHVPFLVYLPNGGPGMGYAKEFSTLLTQDLILELVENHLQTHAEVSDWIASRTTPPQSGAMGR